MTTSSSLFPREILKGDEPRADEQVSPRYRATVALIGGRTVTGSAVNRFDTVSPSSICNKKH